MAKTTNNVTTHNQSGGVTAGEINTSKTSNRTKGSRMNKWLIGGAVLGALASIVALLTYFGIGGF